MDSKKLREMCCEKSGNLKNFAAESDINYNTLYYSLANDERLDHMPIANFILVAHKLGTTADKLVELLVRK